MTGVQRLAGLLRRRPPHHVHTREYSFFSSKGSGNRARYFTGNSNSGSSKALGGRVNPTKETSTTTNTAAVNAKVICPPITVEAESASTAPNEDVRPTTSKELPLHGRSESTPHSPLTHPALTTRKLGLHNFFSLHRPLLLLSDPTSSLFDEPSLSSLQSRSSADEEPDSMTAEQQEEESHSDDSESAAALLLSYSLITSTLGPRISFEAALARLGSKESMEMQNVVEEELKKGRVLLDSVKRKKRKKMSRHKLKKRKRALREIKRRTGK